MTEVIVVLRASAYVDGMRLTTDVSQDRRHLGDLRRIFTFSGRGRTLARPRPWLHVLEA